MVIIGSVIIERNVVEIVGNIWILEEMEITPNFQVHIHII
jgi:hypothetical protein